MEGEIYRYAQVWFCVLVSLCYCHLVVAKMTRKGLTRLFCLLPVICLFFALPLRLHSVHLGGTTAFFLAWLANSKLFLFAFGQGPLSADPSISLPSFVALACFPIKIQHHPSPKSNPNAKIEPRKGPNSPLNYATKALLLGILIRLHDYSEHFHPKFVLFLHCFHIYFCLEIVLGVFAALSRALLRLELEPQFNDPYLSTSLQDFWGRRWNLMVTSILRPTVYEPIRDLSSRAVGRRLAPLLAVMATFLVSAVMHELMIYYLCRVRPTWEITWFFILHGASLVAEISLKKLIAGRFRLPGLVSGALSIGFVMVTAFWLFFPQFLQCKADDRAFAEYAAAGAFLKDVGVAVADTTRRLTNFK